MAVFIGIDLGTSSIKASAIDQNGKVCAQAERNYRFDNPRDDWLEIHPEMWWSLTREVLRDTVAQIDAHQVKGVCVCGVMMMAVMLDKDGAVIRPTLSWLDQRVLPQLHWLKRNHFDTLLYETTGTALSPSQTILPLLWVRENEPENFRRIHTVMLSKDYIRYRLTGIQATDYTDASATLLLDNRTGTWNTSIAEQIGITGDLFPRLLRSADVAGHLRNEVATELGLPAGLPVIAGSGDGVSTMLGLGIIAPGQIGVTVGTAGVLMSTSSSFIADEEQRCLLFLHPIPDRWYLTTATNTSGEAVRWFTNTIYEGESESDRYTRLMKAASESPPGARGVLFHPLLSGSRSPHYNALARAAFLGLSLHHSLADIARSVLEGVAYELKDCFVVHQEMLAKHETTITSARISGGIIRSRLWLQILADILDVSLEVPNATELGALGAAVNAAVGVGYYRDYTEAVQHMIAVINTIEPSPKNRALYAQGYELYRQSYEASMSIYEQLNRYSERSTRMS